MSGGARNDCRDAARRSVDRNERRLHAVRRKDGVDQHGLAGGQAVVIEDEVAEAVDDEVPLVELDPLQDVRMVADHQVGPGVDGGVGLGDLVGDRRVGVLDAPVKADDDVVDTLRLSRRMAFVTRLMSVRAVATPGPAPA